MLGFFNLQYKFNIIHRKFLAIYNRKVYFQANCHVRKLRILNRIMKKKIIHMLAQQWWSPSLGRQGKASLSSFRSWAGSSTGPGNSFLTPSGFSPSLLCLRKPVKVAHSHPKWACGWTGLFPRYWFLKMLSFEFSSYEDQQWQRPMAMRLVSLMTNE